MSVEVPVPAGGPLRRQGRRALNLAGSLLTLAVGASRLVVRLEQLLQLLQPFSRYLQALRNIAQHLLRPASFDRILLFSRRTATTIRIARRSWRVRRLQSKISIPVIFLPRSFCNRIRSASRLLSLPEHCNRPCLSRYLELGGPGGASTLDPPLARRALSQLSYWPDFGARHRARTCCVSLTRRVPFLKGPTRIDAKNLVRREGFEPPTLGLGNQNSLRLSYRRKPCRDLAPGGPWWCDSAKDPAQ